MKINPALRPAALPQAPFGRPAATFDRPSLSFADFLGDSTAQHGAGAAQASSFGAKGMFGSAASTNEADRPPAAPLPADLGPDFEGAEGAKAEPALPTAFPRAETSATLESQPRDIPLLSDQIVDLDEADASAMASRFGSLDATNGAEARDKQGAEIEIDHLAEPTPPEPEGPTVAVLDDGETLNVGMRAEALAPASRDRLRRQVAQVLADHGEQLGDLYVNGELLTSCEGGIDDRFPG